MVPSEIVKKQLVLLSFCVRGRGTVCRFHGLPPPLAPSGGTSGCPGKPRGEAGSLPAICRGPPSSSGGQRLVPSLRRLLRSPLFGNFSGYEGFLWEPRGSKSNKNESFLTFSKISLERYGWSRWLPKGGLSAPGGSREVLWERPGGISGLSRLSQGPSGTPRRPPERLQGHPWEALRLSGAGWYFPRRFFWVLRNC